MIPAAATAIFPAPTRARIDPLALAARAWYLVICVGQLAFVLYILGFYGGSIARGQYQEWNKVLAGGYVAGDAAGNIAVGVHTLCAAAIMLCGTLQLLPALRARMPTLHRVTGRLYVGLSVLAALAGLWMMWTRPVTGGPVSKLGLSVDALLIVGCAVLAVRHARAGRIDAHRRWALRLFMAVSAVWFYRVGLMFWIAVNGGPAGFDPVTFTGPALDVLAFAQFLLPLALLELYLRAGAGGTRRMVAAGVLALATAAMAVGLAVTFMALWLPHMR